MSDSIKKDNLLRMLKLKKECEKTAMEVVYCLIETNLTKEILFEKAVFISHQHWDDIVIERKVSGICGWPLCDNEVKNTPRQKYIIRNNKVLDITDRKNYCSSRCYGHSEYFKSQIPKSPLWLRGEEPTPEFKLAECIEDDVSKLEIDGLLINFNAINLNEDEENEGLSD